jgi:hypothetical protein
MVQLLTVKLSGECVQEIKEVYYYPRAQKIKIKIVNFFLVNILFVDIFENIINFQ